MSDRRDPLDRALDLLPWLLGVLFGRRRFIC